MKHCFYIAILQMLASLLACNAFANDELKPLIPGTLMVGFSDGNSSPAFTDELLSVICNGVGQKLTQGAGVFDLGIFTDVNCSSGENAGKGDIFWLKIRQEELRIFFTIGLVTAGKPFLKMAEVSVGNDKSLLKLLESKPIASMISYALLDQMPFQAAYSGDKRKSKKHKVTDDEIIVLNKGVMPPELLVAFTASINEEGVIYPEVVGRINTGKIKSSRNYLHETARYNAIQWRFKGIKKQVPEVYFGLRKAGRSVSKKALSEILENEVEAFYEDANQSIVGKSGSAVSAVVRSLVGSGYLGLRYGPALLEGDLIDQSKYFGAIMEFRSGILGGLRLYYDFLPEVTGMINGQEGTFGGDRTIVAYSFSMSFDSIIRKIDLTPKAGIWNFRSKTPIEIEPGVYVAPEFEVKSAPSFDIELGLESGSSFHILRGWASNGSSVLAKDGAEISSTRVGVDLLLSPWVGSSSVTVSLLSFFFYEAVELKKSQKVIGEDAELDQLNYSQGYAGGGLAISW